MWESRRRWALIPGEGERFSSEPGMAFTMPGMFFTGTAALDITPAQ